MNSLLDRIKEITASVTEDRHSYFQLKYFVIGKEPTVQAKIRACVRELADRQASIIALEAELTDVMKKITSFGEECETSRAMSHHLSSLRSKLRGKEQEALFLIEMYEHLITIEEPKDWDDFEVQKEYWSAKLNMELNARLVMGSPLDAELVKTIWALPDDAPVKVNLIDVVNKLHRLTDKRQAATLEQREIHNVNGK